MPDTTNTCAAKSCTCKLDMPDTVQIDGRTYCSERCSEGRGCDHAGCNCGKFPTAEPPEATHPQH
jgi:hypothetical protein